MTATHVASPDAGVGSGRRLVVQVWLASRLLLLGVAVAVAITTGRNFADMVGNWDVQHFIAIATHGYAAKNDIAFFPGLPLLMRALGFLRIPALAAGVVISLVGSALAAWALLRLGGPYAAALWLIAPTAVFTAVGYTEAAFCAAAFWAWERASKGRWAAAAVLASVACTVRVSGLFLVGALVILALTTRGQWRKVAWLALPTATLAAYFTYLYVLTGNWNAWYEAQVAGWSRGFTWPWVSFMHTWNALVPGAYPTHPEWEWIFRGEMVSMVVGLAVAVIVACQKRWAESAYVAVQVLAFSVSYWFWSVNRAVLLWFPLWLLLGRGVVWVRQRHNPVGTWLVGAAVLADLGVMMMWAWAYFTGMWAS